MNLRDLLTLFGTILTALGVQLGVHGTTPATFWAAIFCGTAGPILAGARAVIKAPDTPAVDPNATRKLVPLLAIFCSLGLLTGCSTALKARLVADGKTVLAIAEKQVLQVETEALNNLAK